MIKLEDLKFYQGRSEVRKCSGLTAREACKRARTPEKF